MSLVLDASMAVAAVHLHETTPAREAFLQNVLLSGAWVPSLWHLEVLHVFFRNERLGKYTAAVREQYLSTLRTLPITVDSETDTRAWKETKILAERHRLSSYDASYLELAVRRSLPLATLDDELQKAALAEGVVLLTA